MIAAEAHASGIPLVAPDMGGAGDFVRNTALGFKPADTSDVVRAILELPVGARKAIARRTPRSMEEHFRELYRLYAGLGSNANTAAA
jgi:alpha-1,6-mannosyltransferase